MRIPPGFSSVTPYFFIANAAAFLDFLERAFGGIVSHRQMDGARVAHAHVTLNGFTVMVSDATKEFPAMPASYYLYVENADETMQRAVEAGATRIMEVADMPYGDRQGGIRDAHGNIWWVSQRLVDGPY